MFLMKYFATVAAEEVSSESFYLLNVAPYLEDAKCHMLAEVTGASPDEVYTLGYMLFAEHGTLRMAYPHLPQSYCLLATQISYTVFN